MKKKVLLIYTIVTLIFFGILYKDVENKGFQRLFLWGMEKKRPHNIDSGY